MSGEPERPPDPGRDRVPKPTPGVPASGVPATGADRPTRDTSAPAPDAPATGTREAVPDAPAILGDVVFGGMESPVAVCTLASRSLLPALAGRPEIAVAGRVFTENVGIERMVQNLAAFTSIRYLIVCGRETPHRVAQTIFSLHRFGLDEHGRVVGSDAPEPYMPNLTAEQLRTFQERILLVDLVGVTDAEAIAARARALCAEPPPETGPPVRGGAAGAAAARGASICGAPATGAAAAPESEPPAPARSAVEAIVAERDPPSAWVYDPVGFFLVFVDRERRRLRLEQYGQDRRLVRVIEGRNAEELCHTVVRIGQVTLLAHAAYLGRELARAEAALALGLDYEQDRPLAPRRGTVQSS